MVKLDPDIVLKHVFHTRFLKCNLISTQKLAIHENCIASYGPNFCIIQDLTLKMQIGAGDLGNGVYYLKNIHGGSIFIAVKKDDSVR